MFAATVVLYEFTPSAHHEKRLCVPDKLSASGAAAVNDDFYDLPGGTRASGPGHGWPMVRAVSKNRENKDYGPESAKLGWALPARG